MRKRVTVLLVILVGLIFLSSGFISAASCDIRSSAACREGGGDYIVMGVSDLTNAHGEFPDIGTYDSVLCCDFGTGNTACNGNNKIIGLSSATNAHAEIPTETTYATEVCYEDLDCVSLNATGSNCDDVTNGDYSIDILSLSVYTNAHIGGIDDYPGVSICCASNAYAPPPCDLTDAYWSLSRSSPTPIVPGTAALDGQDVYLIVEGTNCAGKVISFEVWEGGVISQGVASVQPLDVTFGSRAIGTWSAEFMSTFFDPSPEYYFIATVDGSSPIERIESPNPKLEVISEGVEVYCLENSFGSCIDYNEDDCNSDLCSVADNGGEFCTDHACSCSWNAVEGICETEFSANTECGNGFIDVGEQCENMADLIDFNCSDFDDFTGGDLSCTNCMIDTSVCLGGTTGTCGDGIVNTGEQCESAADLIGFSCSDFGDFTEGSLSCVDCEMDTSACISEEVSGTCSITQVIESRCEDPPEGLFIYSWTGIWTGVESGAAYLECIAGGDGNTIECPSQIQLPFFTFYNGIIALVLTGLIYVLGIFSKKQRKTSKGKSSKKRNKK